MSERLQLEAAAARRRAVACFYGAPAVKHHLVEEERACDRLAAIGGNGDRLAREAGVGAAAGQGDRRGDGHGRGVAYHGGDVTAVVGRGVNVVDAQEGLQLLHDWSEDEILLALPQLYVVVFHLDEELLPYFACA